MSGLTGAATGCVGGALPEEMGGSLWYRPAMSLNLKMARQPVFPES